jgi:hypothetical protein
VKNISTAQIWFCIFKRGLWKGFSQLRGKNHFIDMDRVVCTIHAQWEIIARLFAELFRFLPYVWFGCFPYIPLP